MKVKSFIIKVVILGAVLILLFNPGINPLLDAAAKEECVQELQAAFGGADRAAGAVTIPKLTALAALIGVMWLLTTVINFILDRISEKGHHGATIITLIASLVKYASVIICIIGGLGILGVNTAGILASVGILSLIIGFGAQSLIEDTITGIFIIFEHNFEVGDYIILDDFRGRVKKIGIRTICIEDDGGNIKIVNNSDIRNFQNRSENLSVAVCDVGISYDADIREVEKIIEEAVPAMYENNRDVFESEPMYKGVESLGDSAVVLRMAVYTKEGNFFVAKRRLNRELKLLFDEKGIEIPFTQIVLHNAE